MPGVAYPLANSTAPSLTALTPLHIEALYDAARQALLRGEDRHALHTAANDLAIVVGHNSLEPRYVFAFALALHMLGHHEMALRFYAHALMLRADDPVCTLRIGECHQALGDLSTARDAFADAVKLTTLSPEYAPIREAAQLRLDGLTAVGA